MKAMSAELAAQVTAARAVAADYAREARGEGCGRPDWYMWAARLHLALVGVLGSLGSGPGDDGTSAGESVTTPV
jgi:hypothetical protein